MADPVVPEAPDAAVEPDAGEPAAPAIAAPEATRTARPVKRYGKRFLVLDRPLIVPDTPANSAARTHRRTRRRARAMMEFFFSLQSHAEASAAPLAPL